MTIEKRSRVVFENDPETDKRFLDAFDRREAARIESDALGRAATKVWTAAEVARVQAVLAEDRAYRSAEHDRKRARIEVGNGSFANLVDTVMPPTPEWLAKGEVKPFTPRLMGEGGQAPTVKTVRTVRRVSTQIIHKMHASGNLTDDQFEACRWYAERHLSASLDGRYKLSNISFTSGTSGGCGDGQSPMALYLHEARARLEFRAAREKIPAFYLKFFESIVLGDIPMRRAVRFARCRTEKGPVRFRECCGILAAHLAAVKAKMVSETDAD